MAAEILQTTLLTIEELANVLHVSIRTLNNYRAQGLVPPSFSIGRHVYWHREAIDIWLREQAGLPTAEKNESSHKKLKCKRQ